MSQRILLLLSDAASAKVVIDALSHSDDADFEVEWVRTCTEGLERLDGIAAVLADLFLSDSRGIDTFEQLHRAGPGIPIMVLGDLENEAIAKLAVQRGAYDYLFTSGLDAYFLPRAVGSMIERSACSEALFEEKERAQLTLNSIGEAVVSTNVFDQITYLNAVAEDLTGRSLKLATGRPLESIVQIIDATTRLPAPNPMTQAIKDDRVVALRPNCVLIRRDGTEAATEGSAAPIHDRGGAVNGAVMVFHNVSEARALALKLSYFSQHDSLTDLPNRVLLNDRLTEGLTLSSRYHRKLAILFLDLDHFKHINDSLGNTVGDLLLQSVARRLFTCVRSSDTVARHGDDEFVVVLWEVRQAEDAGVTATKILEEVRKPYYINGHEVSLTGSIGVVTFPDDGEDARTLMEKADSAMCQAKESGRDRFQFFKWALTAKAAERQSLEASLRQAIELQEFELHYQPRLNLMSREVLGAEALIRWRHPQHGLIPPGQFIGIAKDCGLMVPIGRWVLRQACLQARTWQAAGIALPSISVNISAEELYAPQFALAVREILVETGLESRYLELDLTETTLKDDSRSVSDMLRELKEIGVLLALDDFGTGYSSLTQLRRFPIDTLKIDRSLVQELATNEKHVSIVTAMIGMGRDFRMQVVAEGVESQRQLEILQEYGCPQAQGYYLGRPIPADEFGRSIRSRVPATASA